MAFARATEDEEKVRQAVRLLLPPDLNLKESRVRWREEIAKGVLGNHILVIDVYADKKSDARKLWKHIRSLLSEADVKYILSHPEDFLDEHGTIHLRFDKQEAYLGKPILTGGGDVVKVRAQLEAYPAKPEEFLKAFHRAFEE
ncbi:MAG: hypothetical protein GXN93_01945 [Candidatus Diapherotrites archaeon]|nr:hypothetical protein [Candidatus Diapherotrites archaeon]